MRTQTPYPQLAPQTYQAMLALENSLTLEPSLKELVKLRVSQINGCLFCADMHSKVAKLNGERELRLYHLPLWRESTLFSEREKVALAWAEKLTLSAQHHVSDEDYQAVRAHFEEEELVALTFVISTINAWNRIGVAFSPVAGSADKLMGLDKAGLA